VRPRRVVQVVGAGPVAAGAAAEFVQELAGSGLRIETRTIDAQNAATIARALAGIGARDTVVLWLSPDEIRALASAKAPAAPLYFSSHLGNAERIPLPLAWRATAHLVYPYELPALRGSNLAYFRAWINQRKLPLLDEQMQSEVYFAVNYLSETLGEMLNNLYRDYLVERAETMLSRREARKAEDETRERQSIHQRFTHVIQSGNTGGSVADAQRDPNRAVITPEENLGRRTGTTAFPPLGLGPGQRFASKGAYIVRLAEAPGAPLKAESGWIVPHMATSNAHAEER